MTTTKNLYAGNGIYARLDVPTGGMALGIDYGVSASDARAMWDQAEDRVAFSRHWNRGYQCDCERCARYLDAVLGSAA